MKNLSIFCLRFLIFRNPTLLLIYYYYYYYRSLNQGFKIKRVFFRPTDSYRQCLLSRLFPQKKYILGLGPEHGPKPRPKINSEFNSIHFGIEINKLSKFLTLISFWV